MLEVKFFVTVLSPTELHLPLMNPNDLPLSTTEVRRAPLNPNETH